MTYGGDISPQQCWDLLQGDDPAILVDVRTRAEWSFVGVPTMPNDKVLFLPLEWQAYPHMEIDPQFADKVVSALESNGLNKETNICFLCRSGVRSLAAAKATTSAGYANTFNITGGFEGDPDENGHRGNKNGWKYEKLPWKQQ